MSSLPSVKVGTWEVRETEEWGIVYETASYYRTIEVKPGTYPVYAYPYAGYPLGNSLSIRAEGICVASFFNDGDIGQSTTVHKNLRHYDVGELIASGTFKITNPEITTEEWDYDGETLIRLVVRK